MRGPGLLAGHARRWDGSLLDGKDGRASVAIENESEAHLGKLDRNVTRFLVDSNGGEDGRGGIVVIEDVVMDGLIMPLAFAREGIEREDAIGV